MAKQVEIADALDCADNIGFGGFGRDGSRVGIYAACG